MLPASVKPLSNSRLRFINPKTIRQVITKLNLASNPFRNRTLPWTVALVVSCASLIAIFLIVSEGRRTGVQADRAENGLLALRREREALLAQANEVRQTVPPTQLKTLEAAHLLVDRKRFSWSRLFVDLESSLPQSVRVSRISVRQVTRRGGQTRADLDLNVVGRAPADVTGMITVMNRAGTFTVTPASETPRPGKGDGGIEWALRVSYVQRTLGSDGGGNGAATSLAASTAAPPQTTTTEARP